MKWVIWYLPLRILTKPKWHFIEKLLVKKNVCSHWGVLKKNKQVHGAKIERDLRGYFKLQPCWKSRGRKRYNTYDLTFSQSLILYFLFFLFSGPQEIIHYFHYFPKEICFFPCHRFSQMSLCIKLSWITELTARNHLLRFWTICLDLPILSGK